MVEKDTREKKMLSAFTKHRDNMVESGIATPILDGSSDRIVRYNSRLTKAVENYYGVRRRRKHQPPTGWILPWIKDSDWSDQKENFSVDDFIKTRDRLWCRGTPSKLIEIVRDINLDEDTELYADPNLECSKVRYCFKLQHPMVNHILKPWFYTSVAASLGCVVASAITSDPRYANGIAVAGPFLVLSVSGLLHEKFGHSKDEFPGSKPFFELYRKSREADRFVEGLNVGDLEN
jgi:hypothetical protein